MENTKVIFKDESTYGEVQLFSDDNKAGKMDIYVLAQFKRHPADYADVWLKRA